MRTVSYRLSDLSRVIIPIGKVAENEATQVRIDSSEVFADYPTAVPSLSVLNPSGESYPVSVSADGVFVLWNVKDSDLTAEGDGEFQLSFTVNTTVVKSSIGHTHVCRSIVAEGEAPDPIQNWLDDAEQTLAKIDSAIPEGGTTGQVLAKKSNTDFDTEWVDQTGGGGGGTSDYTQLTNKPQIAGVTLTGNKSLHDLGAAAESDIPDVSGFYTKPSGGIPATDIAEGVIPDVSGFYTKPSGGIPASDLASAVQTSLGKADTAYQKPGSGIPASDIASGVIPDPTSIIDDTAGDGDTNKVWSADKSADLISAIQQKYTLPSDGIPSSDMASAVQTSLGKADTAYQKPSGGIPLTDIESNVTTVSGSTPSITGVAGFRYICGECSTLSITAPASGIIDVIFESGSTPTVLTVSSSIKWANGFDPTSLEANTTYELNILDGELGVVGSWT